MTLEADVLTDLVPGDDERQAVADARKSLEDAATKELHSMGLDGVAQVQGSVAKDTWIAGDADMDCFLILAPETEADRLESIVDAVAKKVLESPRKKYAQHPYLIGTRDGFQVDLVPAYRITSPDQRSSAVDRTPLHTAWVQGHLDDDARDQVRLTKQWCKGVGAYGAETRIGGFSGYLLEVLVHHLKGLQGFLDWAAKGCTPRRVTVDGREDAVEDEVSPLVVVDPVDPTRNCAAAVTDDTLTLLQEAAVAYQRAPDRRFFHPAPPQGEAPKTLHDSLEAQESTWLGIRLRPRTDRLDIVFPQFQRAARVASEAIERAGFTVHRFRVDTLDDDAVVGLQWVLHAAPLPATRTHRGPPADQQPNASRFQDKWEGHPDADGPVTTGDDGRLQVTVRTPHRTPADWLQTNAQQVLVGKHVVKALTDDAIVLFDPAEVTGPWAAVVADHVLDRRPWQRS